MISHPEWCGEHQIGPQLPTWRDVNVATTATAAVLRDPDATAAERDAALEAEAATLHAYEHRPAAAARLATEPRHDPHGLTLGDWSGRPGREAAFTTTSPPRWLLQLRELELEAQ
jgi:hypothetical protein